MQPAFPVKRAFSYVVLALVVGTTLSLTSHVPTALRVILWAAAIWFLLVGMNAAAGNPVPFLRWSFLRMAFSRQRIITRGEVGDHRESEAVAYVLATSTPGDIESALRAFDRFAYERKFLINVGDKKGAILDDVIRAARPQRVLELGTYLGYSALRIARLLPEGGHVYSIERNEANARLARKIVEHAGVVERVEILVGTLGDDTTMRRLVDLHGFGAKTISTLFIDHDKDEYVTDLERVLAAGWLRDGATVLADNIGIPGAPGYLAFIAAGEGRRWTTRSHRTHAEYQSILSDLMLETTLLAQR